MDAQTGFTGVQVRKPEEKRIPIILFAIRERMMFDEYAANDPFINWKYFTKVEGYDAWDLCIESAGTTYICEVKVRNKNLSQYDDFYIEQIKYDALKKITSSDRAIKKGTRLLYINFFHDGVIFWELDKIDPKFSLNNMKSNTFSGKAKKIDKPSASLKKNLGITKKYNTMLYDKNRDAISSYHFLFPGQKKRINPNFFTNPEILYKQ